MVSRVLACWQLLVALASIDALVTGMVGAVGPPAFASVPPRVLGLSIPQGAVLSGASAVKVSFNVPMDVASVGYATTLVRATGRGGAQWEVQAPISAQGSAGARVVELKLVPHGRLLAPGAYSLVIGPAVIAASGLPIGYTSVTDFVVAPYRSLWEKVTVAGEPYDVWVATEHPGPPVQEDGYLANAPGGTVFSGSSTPVSVVYSTGSQGRLVTSDGLASELESYAEEEGWLRHLQASSVPSYLALDPGSLRWAIDNGPGSALANYLYYLAKSSGEDVTSPPSQTAVDQAEVASGLSRDGPPGDWASELAADEGILGYANSGNLWDHGYVLAQQLTTLVSEGALSLPGAEAAKAMLAVLKTVKGAAGFGEEALYQLHEAEWEATLTAAETAPLGAIAAAMPSSDAQVAMDISALTHLSLAEEQAVIARAATNYALTHVNDIATDIAKELLADSDPVAAAVVYGLDLGFFIASFTGWDQLRADFYQAVEQAEAEKAFVEAAQALVSSVQSAPSPTPAQLEGGLLAWRLAYNTMADFYAECVTIVHLNQWGEAVDGAFKGLEPLVGTDPAEDMVPTWRSDEAGDRALASGWLPGQARTAVDDNTFVRVGTDFPAVPAGEVPVSLCGTVITEPGRYGLTGDLYPSYLDYCRVSAPALEGHKGLSYGGVYVAAPGVALDLYGHHVVEGSGGYATYFGVIIGPPAAGALVADGVLNNNSGDLLYVGLADLAPGVLATHLTFASPSYGTGLEAYGTQGSHFVDNTLKGFGYYPATTFLGPAPVAGISLDRAEGTLVAGNTLELSGAPGSLPLEGVGIALRSSSANVIRGNSITASLNGIYAGCDLGVETPWLRSPPRTACAPSTGNQVTGNQVRGGFYGPAIAFGSSTAHNLVTGNRIGWGFQANNKGFVLWDSNTCGVNTWHDNVLTLPLGPGDHKSNRACMS